MYLYGQKLGLLALATGLALCSSRPALGNTYTFATAPGATVTSGGNVLPVDATVQFITALNQITIRVTNLQQETTGTAAQAISAVDFHLLGLTGSNLSPTLYSYQGEIGNLVHTTGSNATFTTNGLIYNSTGGNVANQWNIYTNYVGPGSNRGAQISGGIQLTTLNATGNRTELIIGPPNTAPNTYTANNALRGDSPVLRTQSNTYIEYVIHFAPGSGVTSSTVVDAARMSWNTTFRASTELNLEPTPEPGEWCLILGGLGALAILKHTRAKRSE